MSRKSGFGYVHEKLRDWIEIGELKFDGKFTPNIGDDLDLIIFKLCDVEPVKTWRMGRHANLWMNDADDLVLNKDLSWLWTSNGLTLLKAALIKRDIKELTWERTKSSEPSPS